MGFRVGILTVSDKGSRGQRVDTSGGAIRELLAGLGGAGGREGGGAGG